MANKKVVSVLSTAAIGTLIATAVGSTVFAAVDGLVVKNAAGAYLNYDLDALKASVVNDALGQAGAELYKDFDAARTAGSIVSYHDDKVGFVDAASVQKAALDSALAGTSFVLDTFTESAKETVPAGTVYQATVTDGKVVAGAEVKPTSGVASGLAIQSLNAVSTKTLEVKFNKAVEDTSKVTFTTKKDGNAVNIAEVKWNDAKTVASLSVSYKLFTGKYVVTAKIGDTSLVSQETEVKESAVTKIEFKSDVAVLLPDTVTPALNNKKVTTGIKVLNQYGEDITKAVEGELQFTASKASVAKTVLNGLVTLEDAQEYKTDETVVLTVVHPGTGVAVSKSLKVSAAVDIASIEFGDVTTDEKVKEMYLSTDKTLYKLPLTVKDQYGNEIVDAPTLQRELTVISSNDNIVNDQAVAFEVVSGKAYLKLANGAATATYGNATLTLAAKSGKTASKVVEIKEDAKVDTFTISQPETLVKEAVEFVLPFEAYNQYGTKVVKATTVLTPNVVGNTLELADPNHPTVKTVINVTGGTIRGTVDYKNDSALVIKVTPTVGQKNVIITVTTPTAKVQTMTLAVQAQPKSVSISGLKSTFYSAIQAGFTEAVTTTSALGLKDQYGDAKSLSAGYSLDLSLVDPLNTKVTYNAGTFTASSTTPGTAQFLATLKDDTTPTAKTLDTFQFTMESVALKDISEFGIKDLNKVYTGGQVVHGTALSEYNQTVNIYGKKGTTNVLVDQALVKSVTISSPLAITSTKVIDGTTTVNTLAADKTATLTATVEGANGPILATKEIVYSNATPVVSEIKLVNVVAGIETANTDGVVTISQANLAGKKIAKLGNTSFRFIAKDQYGVEATNLTYTITNIVNAAGATVSRDVAIDAAGTVTSTNLVAGDSFVITASVDGVLKTVKVVVEA